MSTPVDTSLTNALSESRSMLQRAGCVALLMSTIAAAPSALATAAFTKPGVFDTKGHPTAVAMADIDGDGRVDVVTANRDDKSVSILLNRADVGGALLLSPASLITLGSLPGSIAVADINGDGKPDVIVLDGTDSPQSSGPNAISVLLNRTTTPGVPAFVPAQRISVGKLPGLLVSADLNGDGKPDLVIANLNDGSVSILLNTTAKGAASASFAPEQVIRDVPSPQWIDVVDIDGDGKPDLVVATTADASISILRNTTPQNATTVSFAPRQRVVIPPGANGVAPASYFVTVADVNGDGKLDLIRSEAASGDTHVAVALNTSSPSDNTPQFGAWTYFPVLGRNAALLAVDLDGDGLPEIVATSAGLGTVEVLANLTVPGAATPSFGAAQTVFDAGALASSTAAVVDLNSDRLPDVIVTDRQDQQVAVLRNTSVRIDIDQHALTGSWFNPATGGQGFEIEVYPDFDDPTQGIFFTGWFTYDVSAAGGRRWYAASGLASALTPYTTLQIYDVEGGNFAAPPALAAHGPLGTANIQFIDCNRGAFAYRFDDGRSGTIPLLRLTPSVNCTPGGDDLAAFTGSYGLSGNWFDPAESGQGLMFDFAPSINTVFAAWYTFAQNGQNTGGAASQRWYTLQSNQFVPSARALTGIAIIESSGGAFNRALPVSSVQVGSADIAFQNCNALTLTYRFTSGENAGASGTLHLQRAGPVPSICNL